MKMSPIAAGTCVVRATHAKPGRTRSVEPGKTAARHLHYGRIILMASDAPTQVASGEMETGLVCLKGTARVSVAGADYEMVPYDALYIPRGENFTVHPGSEGCDLAEVAAPVAERVGSPVVGVLVRRGRRRVRATLPARGCCWLVARRSGA